MNNKDYSYLDLLSRKLDPAQKIACCRTENSIVAAGAGSGKTQVLATRFAWLVMSCDVPVGEILTLTFTKKAAAEMYSRIYETLSFFAGNEQVPAKERLNAKRALEDFSDAHIQTLDSYCNMLLRQCANRYGITPDFGEGDTEDINAKALSFVYKYRFEEEIKHFVRIGDFQSFATEFLVDPVINYTTISNYKGYFTSKIPDQKKILAGYWNEKMKYVGDITATIASGINAIGDSNSSQKYINFRSFIAGNPAPECFFIKNPEEIGTEAINRHEKEMGEILNWVREVFEQKFNSSGNEFSRSLADFLKTLSVYLDEVGACLDQILNYAMAEKLLYRIQEFADLINEQKRISGNLSFADISQMALRILAEQKDIRTQEKNAYSKIMIDEFQDNNGRNRDLLFLISEKKDIYTPVEYNETDPDLIKNLLKGNLELEKLYFVGDEKQSIYKFRGADVSVFNDLSKDLNTAPIPMVNNYRSKNELLTSFNQIFGGFSLSGQNHLSIFKRNGGEAYEACFPDSAKAQQVDRITHEKINPTVITSSNVRTHVCMINPEIKNPDEDALGPEEQLAYFIAKKIREEYDKGNVKYSSFAILDKRRTNRYLFTKWLTKFEIPFVLDQQTRIFEEAPVNDLYNYLRLCVYPADTNAFASVLTSPFVNISENALEEIISMTSVDSGVHEKKFEPFVITPELEQELTANGLEEDLHKYKKAAAYYDSTCKKFLSQPLTQSITELWQAQGYYYETFLNKNVNLLAEQFDFVFEIARTCDENSQSLAWFIDQLDIIRGQEGKVFGKDEEVEIEIKEVNYPVEREDAVQIMTIHKSKGLQFKTVFIYGCTNSVTASTEKSFFSHTACGFSIRPKDGKNVFFNIYKDDLHERDIAEFNRLVYVAVTRAEENCYILGKWIKKNKNEDNTDKLGILPKILLEYYSDAWDANLDECDKIKFNPDAPFDFTSIYPCGVSVLWRTTGKGSKRTKQDIIRSAQKNYEEFQLISTDVLESNKAKPSGLETEGKPQVAEEPQLPQLQGLDELMHRYVPENSKSEAADGDSGENFSDTPDKLVTTYFDYADFGTLVHAYLCDFVKTGMKEDFSSAEFTGGVKLYKDLNEKDKNQIISYCLEICKNFASSEIGKELKSIVDKGGFVKTEWGFRMLHEGKMFTGSIDLLFQNPDGTYTLLDYKSDVNYNNEKYIGQQQCYRTAAANMLRIDESKIQCKLFYLRYGICKDL